jgi:uncharacterized protein with FMN-binding domain
MRIIIMLAVMAALVIGCAEPRGVKAMATGTGASTATQKKAADTTRKDGVARATGTATRLGK